MNGQGLLKYPHKLYDITPKGTLFSLSWLMFYIYDLCLKLTILVFTLPLICHMSQQTIQVLLFLLRKLSGPTTLVFFSVPILLWIFNMKYFQVMSNNELNMLLPKFLYIIFFRFNSFHSKSTHLFFIHTLLGLQCIQPSKINFSNHTL